ncbi:MAG TPA: FAD-dependent oxidoreductase [Thermoplasmata archaeon]|nr:FAD-dependent oxidoreductase [Thermoplasmata archaeon]
MNPILVIGAGPAGLSAAAELADLGAPTLLVERERYLGGNPTRWRYSMLVPDLKPTEEVLGGLLRKVETDPRIERRLSTIATKAEAAGKGYRVTLRTDATEETREVSAVVVATGFEHFDSRRKFEYGYGRFPDVLDFKELEGMITDDRIVRPSDGKAPRRIAWILCVGSRDIQVGNTWCCRLGCAVSIKQAVEVRKRHPEIEAYVYYMDIRTYGLWERLYWDAMQEFGVKFIRGRVGHITLAEDGKRLLASGEDTILSRPTEIPFDMIVLASGMEPGAGTTEAARLFGLTVGPEGFLAPRMADLNPIDSGVQGVFYAGAATGPKAIVDSVTEGMGAALRAFRYARG